MIVFMRTASVARGKLNNAVAAAKEMSQFLDEHLGIRVGVMMPIGGNPNRIAWTAEYQNLGQLEEAFNKMMADADYGALIAKNAECFIEGSVEDSMWRSI